jgi:hypothetical protein
MQPYIRYSTYIQYIHTIQDLQYIRPWNDGREGLSWCRLRKGCPLSSRWTERALSTTSTDVQTAMTFPCPVSYLTYIIACPGLPSAALAGPWPSSSRLSEILSRCDDMSVCTVCTLTYLCLPSTPQSAASTLSALHASMSKTLPQDLHSSLWPGTRPVIVCPAYGKVGL